MKNLLVILAILIGITTTSYSQKYLGNFKCFLMETTITSEIYNAVYNSDSYCNEKTVNERKLGCIHEFENHDFRSDSIKLRELMPTNYSDEKDKLLIIYNGINASYGYCLRTYYGRVSYKDKIIRGFYEEKNYPGKECYAKNVSDLYKNIKGKSDCDSYDFIFCIELDKDFKIFKMKFKSRLGIEP